MIYYFSNKRTVGATMLKFGEQVSSEGTCNIKCLEIFRDVLKNFEGDKKTPNCIIVRDCAVDWQMSCKWRGYELPTVFEEGVLVEVCVCRGNELSSKINAYFSYNWFSSFGNHSIVAA